MGNRLVGRERTKLVNVYLLLQKINFFLFIANVEEWVYSDTMTLLPKHFLLFWLNDVYLFW